MPQAFQFENLVRGKRILVVDDEKYILDFFVEVFHSFPMQVDTANDGRAAMQKMQVVEYDLIITDFKMPQMSGKDLFDWIKEKTSFSQSNNFCYRRHRQSRHPIILRRKSQPLSSQTIQN